MKDSLPGIFQIPILFRKLIQRGLLATGMLFLLIQSQQVQAASYYWVGGSGDWSDINHWVTTSGGNVNYTHVPTAFDNVYFDANSFTGPDQVVTLNAANYVCRNMNWAAASHFPTFNNLGNFGLTVYGSFKLTPNMNFDITGEIRFAATSPNQTIDMAGQAFNNNVIFDGAQGGWVLTSALNTDHHTLFLRQGDLRTQGYSVQCGSMNSNYTTSRRLQMENSTITVSGSWSVNASNMILESGTSTILMTASNAVFSNQGGSVSYQNVLFTDSVGTSTLTAPSINPVNFSRVDIHNKAIIQGNYTINHLNLLSTYYELRSGDTLTVVQDLTTAGNCAGSVYLRSSADSIPAFLQKISGDLHLDYLVLQDIIALGTSAFVADNSIDLGGNQGWIIYTPAAQNIFWVGGTGNWDDPAHWSYTSGGPGGACVPRAIDNVFFDNHSFSNQGENVTLNCYNAFCHNIDWSGSKYNPTLKGNYPNSLNVFGSMVNIPAMSFSFSGYVNFKASDSGNIIVTAGQEFLNRVRFKGQHGHWEFMDDFNAEFNVIELEKGYIDTHNHKVSCAGFYSFVNSERGLRLGSSIVNVFGTHPNAWMVSHHQLAFDAGTSTINFLGSFGGMLNASLDTVKFWHVNFLNTNGCGSLSSVSAPAAFRRVQFFNNGNIIGNNIYDTLNFYNSFYSITANTHQRIKKVWTNAGNCGIFTYIFSSDEAMPAFFDKDNGAVVLDYAMLQNIHVSGNATFTAMHSVDLGNNTGWQINPTTPRDLYWVGGNGLWNDAAHWSLSSGGAGGECVPNPSDNVFFDNASFNGSNQSVYINTYYAFCHNITWTGVNHQPTFAGISCNTLLITGSFSLCTGMSYANEGSLSFKAMDSGNIVRTAGALISSKCTFSGENGSWSLADDFTGTKSLQLIKGSLSTESHDLSCKNFISTHPLNRSLMLGNSTIILTANDAAAWLASTQNFSLNAGASTIRFIGANGGMTNNGQGSLTYHNVFFEDTAAWSELTSQQATCTFNRVFFRSNGRIWGTNTFDTLTFFPAKTYVLESGLTQTIQKQLDLSGNGCFPITLKSSISGNPSTFFKSTGTVSAAFVEMHDQRADGGATFYAGNYSINVSGNSGWIFGTGQGYFFGLPDVSHICPGDTLSIGTYNFIGGETFEWQDGSTGPYFVATQPGTYIVKVTYADNCYLSDTMSLMVNSLPFAHAGQDTSICPAAQVSLICDAPEDAAWIWSTGDTTRTVQVSPAQSTVYTVTATNQCGSATDQVTVSTYPVPVANAGQDTAVCPGTPVTLNATGLPNSTFVWSNAVQQASFTIHPTLTTTYAVTVTDAHQCGTATDEVVVTVYPLPFAEAGVDTAICTGESVTLNVTGLAGSSWLWSNGSTHSSNPVHPAQTTLYTVTATDAHHCGVATDSVLVKLLQVPQLITSGDTTVCPGSPVSLTAYGEDLSDVIWNTGDTTWSIMVAPSSATTYMVQASNKCGTVTAGVTVNMHALPQFQEIISEESCQRQDGFIRLLGDNDYLWSNGDTTSLLAGLSAGIYAVTISNDFCSLPASFTVTELAGPEAAFTANADYLYDGQNFIFRDASTGATDWSWDFGDQQTATGSEEVSHLYAETGTYQVTLKVTDLRGCTDTASLRVTMEYPDIFWMPNAFTPNNDGLNETFGPTWRLPERVSDYSMSIFNRWGEEIFTTRDMYAGWDGSDKQKMVADGMYTWKMQVTETPGLKKVYTGQVVLLH